VFPHMLLTLAILDPLLAIGAWILLSRERNLRQTLSTTAI
jgi:hypothetical protein